MFRHRGAKNIHYLKTARKDGVVLEQRDTMMRVYQAIAEAERVRGFGFSMTDAEGEARGHRPVLRPLIMRWSNF
jgi:hypothetical protein